MTPLSTLLIIVWISNTQQDVKNIILSHVTTVYTAEEDVWCVRLQKDFGDAHSSTGTAKTLSQSYMLKIWPSKVESKNFIVHLGHVQIRRAGIQENKDIMAAIAGFKHYEI